MDATAFSAATVLTPLPSLLQLWRRDAFRQCPNVGNSDLVGFLISGITAVCLFLLLLSLLESGHK